MILFLVLIISLLFAALVRFSVFDLLKPISSAAHLFCLNHLPPDSMALPELKALVCAENFSNLSQSQLYITSGLIHLFVVSGAHLILIENILANAPFGLKPNRQVLLLILILYGLACGLNPPVTRSLMAFIVSGHLLKKNILWPQHLKILTAGLITLFFNYQWILSFSLQMSWIAAFLVSLGAGFFKEKSILFKQSLFFLTLLPTLVFFQIPSASVILLNIFFRADIRIFSFSDGASGVALKFRASGL